MAESSTPATGRQLELYRIIDRYLNHGGPAKLAALAALLQKVSSKSSAAYETGLPLPIFEFMQPEMLR